MARSHGQSAWLGAAFALALGGAAVAQAPAAAPAPAKAAAPADALTDPALKGPEVLAFAAVKPGDRVADIFAGRFVGAFSKAVGPTGKVYAVTPAEVAKARPAALSAAQATAASAPDKNVEVLSPSVAALVLPGELDVVFIRQNYHDLHNAALGVADIKTFNGAVFAALKPGGVYLILDHADAAGAGLKNTGTTHRIEAAAVKSEVTAAGFVLDGESQILANPADDHSKNVFDPAIRGKTDQFLLRFRKPKA